MTTAPPPIRSMPAPGQRPGGPAPAVSGHAGATLDPVKLLKQYYPYLILASMLGVGLGIALHFMLLRYYPVFTSVVVFECRAPMESGSNPVRRSVGGDEEERFVGTQVNLMTSRIILESALESRDMLDTTWAKPFLDEKNAIDKTRATRQLEKNVSARPVPQSNLVQLRMSAHDPKDAMIIANAVAEAYVRDNRRNSTTDSGEHRGVLTEQVAKLEADIKQLKTDRETVLRDAKMDAADMNQVGESIQYNGVSGSLTEVEQTLKSVESQARAQQERLVLGKADHYPDDLREDAQKDPVAQSYEQKLAGLRDYYGTKRKQGYGDNHPEIVEVKAQIDEVTVRAQEHMKDVLKRLWAAQAAQIDSALKSLAAQRNELQGRMATLTNRRQEILQAKVRFDSIERELALKSEEHAKTKATLTSIELVMKRPTNAGALGDRVRIISSAVIPKGVSFPKIEMIVPATMILVTGLVGGFLFLREILDQRVRGPSDAAMVPRVKVLGVVPDSAEDPSRPTAIETVVRDNPSGVLTESFRQMRAPLIQAMERSGHKSLLVLGCMPGSGSTTVTTNLALSVAGAGERVLIIDANFRRPSIHRVFKVSEGPGLADVLAGTNSLDDASQSTSTDSLKIMSAGSPSARAIPERLAGEAMSRLLLEASAKFDMILVDVPPAVVSGDGYALANKCDASIIVCRAMNEKRGPLARVRNQVGEARAEFVGVVVNAVRASAGGYFKRNIKATHQYQQNGKA